jgi:hypothetical protein
MFSLSFLVANGTIFFRGQASQLLHLSQNHFPLQIDALNLCNYCRCVSPEATAADFGSISGNLARLMSF